MRSDKKVINYKQAGIIAKKLKKSGQKKVLVTGCYDILHLGHLVFFNYAKSQGDVLVVAIGSDETIHAYKGPSRPINNEILRSRLLAGLAVVDLVIICHEPLVNFNMDHKQLIEIMKPDVYVVPVTDKKLAYKRELVEANGGKFITCHRNPPNHMKGGISTTNIIKKL